jgi:ribosomal protein S18 acetylase RimI-like enzyme
VHLVLRRLADGTLASDACLAVRWGRAGRVITAEAIHLDPDRHLRQPIVIGPDTRRAFRGLPATILGWARRTDVALDPRMWPSLVPTAAPRSWDQDWVSGSRPQSEMTAPPAAPARAHAVLTFTLIRVPEGHGADDYEDDEGPAYTLEARQNGARVGALDFNLQDRRRRCWIRWIAVEPAQQRRGIARALIADLERRYPAASLDTGGFTEEGEAFWAAVFGASTQD